MAQDTTSVTVDELAAGMNIDLADDVIADFDESGVYDYEYAEVVETVEEEGNIVVVTFMHNGAETVIAFPKGHVLTLG